MLHASSQHIDPFNPLVPKAHNSEFQNLPFHFQINAVKVS